MGGSRECRRWSQMCKTLLNSSLTLLEGHPTCKKLMWWDVGGVDWVKVQTCIWPSRCHCHSLSLAPVNPDWFLPFWYLLTWVVPDKFQKSSKTVVRVCGAVRCAAKSLHSRDTWRSTSGIIPKRNLISVRSVWPRSGLPASSRSTCDVMPINTECDGACRRSCFH